MFVKNLHKTVQSAKRNQAQSDTEVEHYSPNKKKEL